MTSFILLTSLQLMTTHGFTPGPRWGPTEEDSREDEEDENALYGIRFFWPIAATVSAALIFGVIYSCSRKKKCIPGGSSRNQQPPEDPSQTHDNSMNFANRAFDDIADTFSDFPGSSFGEGIEMVPPPYCEKPPDYDDIYRDTSDDTTARGQSQTLPSSEEQSPFSRNSEACNAGETRSMSSDSADDASGTVLQVTREEIDTSVLNIDLSERRSSTAPTPSVDL